ncbi:MAG: ribosomal protein L7/L12 [Vicinamibacterales bacterium]|jgi:hypothetical protein
MTPPLPDDLPAAAVEALRRQDKIGAIKIVREQSHLGLKEAKDAVEAYVDRHPDLKAAMQEASSQGVSRLLVWAIVIGVIAFAAWKLAQ